MDAFSKFTLPGLLLMLTMAFGFWLSHTGKPYNGLLFNLHKLIALGAVVYTAIQVSKVFEPADSLTLLIVLLVVAVCIVALFASGALMSMGKLDYTLTLTIHRIAPVVLVITLGVAVYLLT